MISKRSQLFYSVVLITFLTGLAWGFLYQKQHPLSQTISSITKPPVIHRFVMLADTGAATPAQFEVAKSVKKVCDEKQNCEAAFIAGDIIYENGVSSENDPQFKTKFEDPYHDIELPFYIAYGNHDYIGCAECYLAYTQKSSKWRMPAAYYVQMFDDVSFFVIDTEKFSSAQQQWLRDALAVSTAKWKIVVGHRPLKTYEVTKVGENWNGKQELQDIICHNADIYVAGHAHILEDNNAIGDCSVQQLVVGGGGAYHREATADHHETFLEEGNGFATLAISLTVTDVTFFDKDGTTLFDRTIQR